MSWIDFKLALRMLRRYPGLTIVSVIGMAVAIAISAGAFTIVSALLDPTLPLEEGDRVVSIVNWDVSTNNREPRVMRDFADWRKELTAIQDLGAVRTVARNLIAPGAQPEPVTVAEMAASGFSVARVQPALGRYILPEDERPGAPDVVVIGHDIWLRRFAGDSTIVGQPIQLGDRQHTIVGVMPKGFAFPVSHNLWMPWRQDPESHQPRSGPTIEVFGRLAPRATLESAQSELSALGQRTGTARQQTHEHLRPRVKLYAHAYTDMDDRENYLGLHAIQTALGILLVVVCVNVGILVYARTATRQGEIAVRTALCASRRRVVGQLTMEALVLAGVAALVGVGLVGAAMTQLDAALVQLTGSLPFWMKFELSTSTMLYIVALTLLAGAIVGVLPALKATGAKVQSRLQGLSAGSGSSMQMGRLWTLLIVAQVAFAVALLPAAIYHAWTSLAFRTGDPGYAAHELLTAQIGLDRPVSLPVGTPADQQFKTLYATRKAELERRLEAEPAVSHVTFSLVKPGDELAVVVEADGMPLPADRVDYNIVEGTKQGHLVRFNRVAVDFFAAMEVPVLTGRGFGAGDAGTDHIVVNRTLTQRLFGGESALGRRVRYVGRSREAGSEHVVLGRWFEIVGVVPDFPTYASLEDVPSLVYHAAMPADLRPAMLSVRARGAAPSSLAGRLREVSAAVDPNLQLRDVSTAEQAARREQGLMRLIGLTLVVVMGSVVILSAAGIYSLMSFIVARRRREIGIRAALGADPTRILKSIFSRALIQLGIGAALGVAGALGLEMVLEGEMMRDRGAILLPAVVLLMMGVGALATLGPARRGLRIQPTEALRAE